MSWIITVVYGLSDDLIEIDGPKLRKELSLPLSDKARLKFSDGNHG